MKTLIKNANIFNGKDNKIFNNKNILIDGSEIAGIYNAEENPDCDQKIEANGKTVIPGLIDAHIHCMLYHQCYNSLSYEAIRASIYLNQALNRGFTTVRDVGGEVWGLVKAMNDGMFKGPRVFYSGKVLSQTGGHGDMRQAGDISSLYYTDSYSNCHQSVIVDGVEALRRAARENFVKGASFVKIMASGGCTSPFDTIYSNQFSIEEIKAAVEVAESYNTYASAHAYMPDSIRRCVENGVRTIEHANYLDKKTAEIMSKKKAFMVPAQVTYNLAYQDCLNGSNKTFFASNEVIKGLLDNGFKAIINAREAGVKIGFGTDIVKVGNSYDLTTPFSSESEEFILRTKVETAFETLNSATYINAEILNMKDKLGIIQKGAFADLLVINGNPLENIKLLTEQGKNINLIMKSGEIVKNNL